MRAKAGVTMKTLAASITAAASLLAIAAPARADEPAEFGYPHDGQTNPEVACVEYIDREVKQYGKKLSDSFVVKRDLPGLEKGTFTLKQLRTMCQKAIPVRLLSRLAAVPAGTEKERKALETETNPHPPRVYGVYEQCVIDVDWALELKLPSSTAIEGTGVTLGTAKKELCSKPWQVYSDAYAKLHPEIAAVLENDKWKLFISEKGSGYLLPGDSTYRSKEGPELAKAKAWYDATTIDAPEGSRCLDYTWVYTKYTFDKDQKLVKTSSKTYCGDPGNKAMR
jgi:hypothetical protein